MSQGVSNTNTTAHLIELVYRTTETLRRKAHTAHVWFDAEEAVHEAVRIGFAARDEEVKRLREALEYIAMPNSSHMIGAESTRMQAAIDALGPRSTEQAVGQEEKR